MLDVLIWNKYARVVMLMAKKQGISPVEALAQFYNAPLFPALRDKDYPLITMGDEWICDNIIQSSPTPPSYDNITPTRMRVSEAPST